MLETFDTLQYYSCRLARRRQYESRREAMGTQQCGAVHEGAGERQEATESSPSSNTCNLVVDDPEIFQIVQQFHNSLATLESVLCNMFRTVPLHWY